MNKNLKIYLVFVMVGHLLWPRDALAEIGDFKGYEIRVIRPRYMTKRGRVELAGETSMIMNQSFIYTFLASGLIDYHFSEMFAIEFGGSYGFSIDKEDKRLLESEFSITTNILRTQYIGTGGLLWTPIYGKTQLPSGQVIYFDDFIVLQGAMTGVLYDYKQCDKSKTSANTKEVVKPAAKIVSYPGVNIGLGQKFFVTQDFALRWEFRDNWFTYNNADGACDPSSAANSTTQQHNITLSIGASTFF